VPDIQEAKCSEFTVQTWKNLERIVQFTMINYQQGGSGGLAPPPFVQIPVYAPFYQPYTSLKFIIFICDFSV